MAQSRLEKIGTIYTRVTGLLKCGAMKPEDKPMWYDLYEAFPPKLEPRYDRPAPNVPIKNILYEEDLIRAKYQKTLKHFENVNLLDGTNETQTQQFIAIYNNLKSQGPLDDNQIFETARELLKERRLRSDNKKMLDSTNTSYLDLAENEDAIHSKEEAVQNIQIEQDALTKSEYVDAKEKQNISSVDVKSLFKD